MEDSSHLYISEFGENEEMEEEEDDDEEEEGMEDSYHEEAGMEPVSPDLHQEHDQDTDRNWDCFPCPHCDRQFTSENDLERHLHIHVAENRDAHAYQCTDSNMFFGSEISQQQNEQVNLVDSPPDHAALPDKQGTLEEPHACKYCEKMFGTYMSKRQHELTIHEQHLRDHCVEKFHLPQEENVHSTTSQQESHLGDNTAPADVLLHEGEQLKQYMLDISSSVSENLSFYIDGKIVSTSTVSSCELAEAHSGSSTLVGLDALILDPVHISQVLNTDLVLGKEILGQPLAKRRTATPPLLPQIQTELESEVVVSSSSSSSLVSSLIETLLPQNTESTIVQTERTVFLSPKLKRLLEKQEGLQPTLALITDGQTPCSPVSLSVLPAGTGKFKRRTGSPPSSPQQNQTCNEETPTADPGDGDAGGAAQTDTLNSSPSQRLSNETDDASPSADEPEMNHTLTEPWSPIIGGNSCNQQPLDLSNTVKLAEDRAAADAVLDLSLQKKSPDHSRLQAHLEEGKSDVCMFENPEPPLVSDFTIVSAADMLDPVADGLLYSLSLPTTPVSAALTSIALQSAPPCTIAFASPTSHALLPAAAPLITVLAPPPTLSNSPSQPLHVLAPNISPEPLVICGESALTSECDLSAAFTAANAANLVTLSQPIDPTLSLPGHMFLTEQIALNSPIVEPAAGSEMPFPPTVTLNDSLLNSFNITSNTVLIECTIALEAPGSVVPAAISLEENAAEPPAPEQMVVNHIEQQQIVSLPNPPHVDPPILVSSIAESVPLSSPSSVIPDLVAESSPDPQPDGAEPPIAKEEEAATDDSVSNPEVLAETPTPETPTPCEKAEEKPSNDTDGDSQQQTFTKNFVCNVCEKLFHSMNELGHHVGDHADEWPYKCEFCVLLFGKPSALLDHRSSLHGVGKTYVCSVCTKEFVYLCNLKQHQEELHPGHQCTHTEEEKGKLRPQNYNNAVKVKAEAPGLDTPEEPKRPVKKEEGEVDAAAEELLTTMKIMASDGGKHKGPDVRLGINQHYPSYKPPPFPYHNRSPAGSLASATNFTTHNIPQTFTTAIRCTKCGNSFDNMPELHKHILACANASDKRRYTPKKNPIPLRHFAKPQNGVLSTTNSTNGLNASYRGIPANRPKPHQDSPVKMKLKVLNKKKKKELVQRTMPQRNKSAPSSNKGSPAGADQDEEPEVFVCPHCSREFTMRRCRTKHMAVCPKKPKEVKKSKEGGIFVTKENNGHLHRGVSLAEDEQSPGRHKTRLQTSTPAKRHAILPVQTVLSNKRSKIIIKEPKQEAGAALNDLPVVRTFNPSMRQYGRAPHGVKEIPIKITMVNSEQREELPPARSQDAVTAASQQSATA
ncbi:PR domain zinc finger protein 2 [Genypterus blacodes]|uniref:PR domain zinc finger protein 2 n=1 Tax=Genypterus blacodes TaxID=154954 RepID=UPI003F76929A